MQALKTFFKEQPFTAWMIVISVVLINIGILFIQYANRQSVQAPYQAVGTSSSLDVPVLEADANMSMPSVEDLSNSIGSIASQEVSPYAHLSADQIREGLVIAEVGSEIWCDLMLEKSDADWTTTDKATFAQYCL